MTDGCRIVERVHHTKVLTPNWLLHMETILEELNEGVVIADSRHRVVFANEALIRMSGYEGGEIQGRTPDAFFPVQDVPKLIGWHQSGQRYARLRHEFNLPTKNSGSIPAIFSGRVIQAPDGQEYALLIITDISEQKRVEAQLRESNALLETRQMEMEAELVLAARVQQSLTPRSLIWNDVSVESYYSPAHTIGGDFGVVFPHSDQVLTILMCDVSGHGIGSALMANRIYSETVHQLESKPDPRDLLRHLRHFVHDRIATDGFYFTMAAVRFTQRGRLATFAAAGHPPAMLVSHGDLRILKSQNGILGCLAETAPSDSAEGIRLTSGDRFVLYTDGLVEVFNNRQEMLGVEGLAQLVLDSAKLTLPQMRRAILDGVAAWRQGPLADDVSLVIIEVH